MTYFRMQLPSHGTGPLAPGHMARPLPGVTSLSTTPARRQLAVKVQPPRAYHRAARDLRRAGPAASGPGGSPGRPAESRPRWRAAARFAPARQSGPDRGSAGPQRLGHARGHADHPVLALSRRLSAHRYAGSARGSRNDATWPARWRRVHALLLLHVRHDPGSEHWRLSLAEG